MIKIISAFLGATLILSFYLTFNTKDVKQVIINDKVIKAEIAEKSIQQQRGLSGRKKLEESDGMLFVYKEPQIPSFWMKDMNFPIDIIWIDENYKIIGIEKSISPNTYPQTFTPPDPVLNVLEVNAGWSETHSIEIGDIVEFD